MRHTRTRTGSRIASQSEMGGWPTLKQTVRRLRTPANPHAIARGQSFRTNLEMWLERFARALEPIFRSRKGRGALALQRDAPIYLVQSTLGHAFMTTTGKSAHVRPGDSSAKYLSL